jgi:hypothetical protein
LSSDTPPRSIASFENATERQIREIGGPAPLHAIEGRALVRAAERYGLSEFKDSLEPDAQNGDATWAARHWPWVAFACHQWLFEHAQRVAYAQFEGADQRRGASTELTPTMIKSALVGIAKKAQSIADDLAMLQRATNNAAWAAKNQPGHIAWLLSFISLYQDYDFSAADAAANGFADEQIAESIFIQGGLTQRLARLSEAAAAAAAATIAQTSALTKVPVGQDPMLPTFVFRLAEIWKSLTGKSTVWTTRAQGSDDERPPFVIFCQAVATVAINHAELDARPPMPTLDMIDTALKNSGRD